LDAGDTRELLTLNRFEAMSLRPKGGPVRTGKDETSARLGELTEDGDRETKIALDDRETVYVHSETDGVTVTYRKQGFLDFIFPRAEVNVRQLQNRDDVDGGQVTATTGGTTLPSIDVPQGFSVAVQAGPGNDNDVKVQNSDDDVLAVLTHNDVFEAEISDPSILTVAGVGSSQTVYWSVEI
jgi:hypothetical protein